MQGHRARLPTWVIVNDKYWTSTRKHGAIVDNYLGGSVSFSKGRLLDNTLLLGNSFADLERTLGVKRLLHV